MLTKAQFNQWWLDFGAKFPVCRDYVDKQPTKSVFLDGIFQSLQAFDLSVLTDVTNGLIKGYLEMIPNTQLGHLGNEIRVRCREVLDQRRKHRPQEWQQDQSPKWSPSNALREPKMAFMLRCAKAADRLLGARANRNIKVYQNAGSVRADRDAHDAAIIMADDHTPEEEARCLRTFAEAGITWDEIQMIANASHADFALAAITNGPPTDGSPF